MRLKICVILSFLFYSCVYVPSFAEDLSKDLISQFNSTISNDIRVVTAPSGASLRQNPNTSSTKLTVVPFLSEVTFLGRDETDVTIEGVTGPWYRVNYKNQEGYIFSGLISSTPEEM